MKFNKYFIYGIVVFTAFSYFIYNLLFSNLNTGYNTYYAKFGNVGSVAYDTKVYISGVEKGKVLNVTFDSKNNLAVVKFIVDNHVELQSDSFIKIKSDGVVGNSYVEIQPGFEDDAVKDGFEFYNTMGFVDIISIFSKFLDHKIESRKLEKVKK